MILQADAGEKDADELGIILFTRWRFTLSFLFLAFSVFLPYTDITLSIHSNSNNNLINLL